AMEGMQNRRGPELQIRSAEAAIGIRHKPTHFCPLALTQCRRCRRGCKLPLSERAHERKKPSKQSLTLHDVSALIVSWEGLGSASTRPAFSFNECPSCGSMFSTGFGLAGHSPPSPCFNSICAAPLKPSLITSAISSRVIRSPGEKERLSLNRSSIAPAISRLRNIGTIIRDLI